MSASDANGAADVPGPPSSRDDVRRQVSRLHFWQFQAVRDVLLIAAVIALIWLGYAMRSVTVPLLIALLLAYLFEPLVAATTRRWRVGRPIVVGGILAAGGMLVLLTSMVLVAAVVNQTSQFIDEVRTGRLQQRVLLLRGFVPEQYRELADEWLNRIDGRWPSDEDTRATEAAEEQSDSMDADGASRPAPSDDAVITPPTGTEDSQSAETTDDQDARIRAIVREELAATMPQAPTSGRVAINWLGIARGGADAVWNLIGRVIAIGFLAFLIPFYFYFFSVWFPDIVRFGQSVIPDRRRERALELARKMDRVVAGFVRGRIIVSLIMGVLLAIGWAFCGVPYAIVLGLVTGIFCAVPFLGIVGLPVAIGLLFVEQLAPEGGLNMAWWAIILWPTVVFSVVQLIESYGLTPLIAGKATNLDPVTMVVAVIAGGSVMGAYGMLLAIPVAACLKIVIMEVLMPKIRAWTEGRAEDPLPID